MKDVYALFAHVLGLKTKKTFAAQYDFLVFVSLTKYRS